MNYIFTHRFMLALTSMLLAVFATLLIQMALGNFFGGSFSAQTPKKDLDGTHQPDELDVTDEPASGLSAENLPPSKTTPVSDQSSGKTSSKALNPVPVISDSDKEFLRLEKEWLIKCQLPQGAIAQTPDQKLIVPYFANLSAQTLVDLDIKRARRYISWYLDNLALPDKWGLDGTIYDYRVVDGLLKPTYNYDSADSYASTFLSLVSHYYDKTKDKGFIVSNLEAIDKVAKVIIRLQDKDGLVFVKPKSSTKYLMDNAENYKGLKDWASLLQDLGRGEMAQEYENAARKISQGIKTVLYDPNRGYAWYYSRFGKRFPVKGRWYPDGVSQVYLISNGVISKDDPEALAVWNSFNAQFPGWEEGVKNDKFPWGTMALAAHIMNDTGRAQRFLAWAKRQFSENDRPYPWYVLESSSLIELQMRLAQEGLPDTSAPSLAGR